jgi:hypothetical protein
MVEQLDDGLGDIVDISEIAAHIAAIEQLNRPPLGDRLGEAESGRPQGP